MGQRCWKPGLDSDLPLSPVSLSVRLEEFCAKILSLLILAHSDILYVWAPRRAPTVASWMDVTRENPLITVGHFLSQATALKRCQLGLEKVG